MQPDFEKGPKTFFNVGPLKEEIFFDPIYGLHFYHQIIFTYKRYHTPSRDWSTGAELCFLWSKHSTPKPPRLEAQRLILRYIINKLVTRGNMNTVMTNERGPISQSQGYGWKYPFTQQFNYRVTLFFLNWGWHERKFD